MITPAKWQAKGGAKNKDFRKDIVPHMSKIVYYPCCYDVFTGSEKGSDYPKIHGGVSYYLIDKEIHDIKDMYEICKVNKNLNYKWKNNSRYIYTLYDERIVNILIKIIKQSYKQYMHPVWNGEAGSINVGICSMYSWGGFLNRQGKTMALIEPYIWSDFDTVTNSMVIRVCSSDTEAKSLVSYINTRFIRFIAFINCTSQNINNDSTWRFIPDPGFFDHIFTDAELYRKYNLTKEEINIIESVIKERT